MARRARRKFKVKRREFGSWEIIDNGEYHSTRGTQAEAIAIAVNAARCAWIDGEPTQVVIFGRDGRIKYERTYGHDPRRRKG